MRMQTRSRAPSTTADRTVDAQIVASRATPAGVVGGGAPAPGLEACRSGMVLRAVVLVHLVVLAGKSAEPLTIAAQLEVDLTAAGLEPLLDDRAESAGVKFNDADLIGLPLRITVSERALKQGGVEFKRRSGGDAWIVPLAQVLSEVRRCLELA